MIYILAVFLPPLGAAAQRAAVLGRPQRDPDRVLHHLRADLSRAVPGPVDPRRDRGLHEARGPQAPRARGCDRAARAAAGLAPLNRADDGSLARSCARRDHRIRFERTAAKSPRIRAPAVLSTAANPKRAVESRARPLFRRKLATISVPTVPRSSPRARATGVGDGPEIQRKPARGAHLRRRAAASPACPRCCRPRPTSAPASPATSRSTSRSSPRPWTR